MQNNSFILFKYLIILKPLEGMKFVQKHVTDQSIRRFQFLFGENYQICVIFTGGAAGHDPSGWGQTTTPSFGSASEWQSAKPNIVVDTKDKEAWPSISLGGADQSENTSETSDDNVSVKSGSVISTSSNQGSIDKSLGSSAMNSQGSASSSLWSSTPASNLNGMDSSSWSGLNIPNSSAISSSLTSTASWSSSITSLSSNNQGHNMQGITSIAGSSDLNNSSRLSGGNWGASPINFQNQQQAVSRPQNSVQIPQTNSITNSIAVGVNAQQNMLASQSAGALQQNGPSMFSAPRQVGQPINSAAASLPQPNSTNSSAFQGISTSSVFPPKSQAELAWNSVSSAPLTQSTNIDSLNSMNSGKGISNSIDQQQQMKSNEAGSIGGWGGPPQAKVSEGGWSSSPANPGDDLGYSTSTPAQWASTQNTDAGKAAAAASQQWAPSTLGSGQEPPRSQPPTWAQAAGKGLSPNPSMTETIDGAAPPVQQPPNPPMSQQDEELMRAIECHEGWGKRPICQATPWDTSPVPKPQRKPSTTTPVEKTATAGASNMWNNNSGTAIWEASKETAPPPPAQWTSSNQAAQAAAPGQWDAASRAAAAAKPPTNPAQWNVPPAKDLNQPGSAQWTGVKPEGNSWPASETPGMSTWGGEQQSQGRGIDDGTSLWNSSNAQKPPPNWNNQAIAPPNPNASMPSMNPMAGGNPAAMMQGVPGMQPGLQPGMQGRPEEWNRQPPQMKPGWGEPAQQNQKNDDGTSLWAANHQHQVLTEV